jgi:peroxiredoxin
VDWDYSSGGINAQLPPVPLPEDFEQRTPQQQAEWWRSWRRSEAGIARLRAERHHLVLPGPEGTFRVEDVRAGRYELEVDLYEPPPPGLPLGRGPAVGSVSHAFEVPPMPGGRSDEPLDLGELELRLCRPLRAGRIAPGFDLPTVDGNRVSLADFRGRFVLLTFWATWWTECRQETRRLKAVHVQFGGRSDFAMVGLSLDADAAALRHYAGEHDLDWPQAMLGDWSATDLPDRYGICRIPSSFLVGPDGRIVAGDRRGPTVRGAVAQALGAD